MNTKGTWVRRALVISFFFCCSSAVAGSRTIKVKNGTTNSMQKYKYLFMKIKPTKFSIQANKQSIEQGEEKTIKISNNKLNVRYDYEFQNGRKGAKVVTFSIPEKLQSITITFAWKKKWRILINGAQPEAVQELKV